MKTWALAPLLLLGILLAACGTSDNTNTAEGTTGGADVTAAPAEQNSLEKIKASGKLRIGTEGTYSPFTYHDADGTLTGFDVDIAREIAKRIGVEAEFIETQWDGIFAGLDAKRFDTIFNEVSITDERKVKYDFSEPYVMSKAVLIVSEKNNDIKRFADLKGKKSGQSLTSNLSDIARQNGAEIVAVEGFNQAIDLLVSGRIDATVNDGLSFLDLKKQKPDVQIKQVDEIAEGSQSAAVFLKGNEELVEAVNRALADMKQDGTYLAISEKYFGADVSK
ncbi:MULTISPECIES: amino acid ABC transporter substrate-binding protein [unclassified Paenibacillus]|uniref:amino acid ABC transporter substrate-binding protein n=1 Tax=unclassified Paenibacillus TaxID=185978 RepID=UPI002406443B|nr:MULTISPECIES: amino acid ABC transporter substrate-binding protein [unclassified Paenibacillus]MDF9842994.1 cystine transport system substrate-binding protein [Paenibacillus sp. PastF-2]MDF9849582.1 cystine transport system substrate-binding protein [Paenibacillus sp. PastM-2]MDF9856043.1 cystine transport system substrate-binding protein [Paenibacillus sp. PastF-1]MDH6481425.1 cystine transport system substrate-binding protein [Paenibacillus sp. PastH-2]MDH6508732.1 cystine transport syste